MKRLKDYFLRGYVDSDYAFRSPELGGPVPFVFRVWLHPERTQKAFDDLLASADAISLKYSEYYVGALAPNPPASFDDVAPMFYELYYLHPEREIEVADPEGGRTWTVPVRHRFRPVEVWACFIGWMIQHEPRRNPICKFLMSRLRHAADRECLGRALSYADAEIEAFEANLRRVLGTREDPRYESVQTVSAMLEAGELPRQLGQWLKQRGLNPGARG